MAGKKGRSGRKKSASTLAVEALERNKLLVPTYLEILRSFLCDDTIKDKLIIDSAKYLINRIEGTPKATHDLRFGRMEDGWTGDDHCRFHLLLDKVEKEQQKLIMSLERDVPESLTERNEIVKVINIWADIDNDTVEAEFQLPSGAERRKLPYAGS